MRHQEQELLDQLAKEEERHTPGLARLSDELLVALE